MVSYITELSKENYENFISNGVVLIDIWAVWCNPCKQISPIIDDLSSDFLGKVAIGKLDADKNPDIVGELGIRSIPTILIYKNGEIVDKSVGITTKQKLSDMLETHLN